MWKIGGACLIAFFVLQHFFAPKQQTQFQEFTQSDKVVNKAIAQPTNLTTGECGILANSIVNHGDPSLRRAIAHCGIR